MNYIKTRRKSNDVFCMKMLIAWSLANHYTQLC